ncbi:MAG: hydrogenase nickel incorporation protein HypA/HybF [Pseudomonadota bacterium]|jgi:hydrogenase nickel incorporation protein HypA/HybF|nr:hydrogenase nickel incorporation protein HypA/HybF [Pseudomonadota bacterium]MDQ5904509.1 hydrogenase nickel incorporation protein HypA/HybF [Pseudomonadota bacterium]MDQ5941798.1 hydrogenase nickel incorporation protein HypA/HybF [Pseudomonadota bacterium]MDQ5945083.1 hydrogenase nickel incorporation protein HypA/HybF [Pseudomonadota bacterium]MDQ5959281.1 hydrogenase nickel incorporation protein HypA/HybF [Pseudomonadota bacterium]
MHEMSLAEGVVQIIEDAAREQGFSKVKTVFLEIGWLSSVEPDAMTFCFDAVSRGTVADGAKLEIIDVPGAGQCLSCGKTVEISAVFDPCPECGGYPVNPTAGTEMRVRELEVD